MDPFLTIYRQDYVKKKIEKRKQSTTESEFKDPITEGFKTYLTIKEISEGEKETLDQFSERMKLEHGRLSEKIDKMYFNKPIDKEIVKNSILDDFRTVYRSDYEDIKLFERFLKEEDEKKRFRLQSDWDLPQTTQTASYRNPKMLNPKVYDPLKIERQPDNLVPNVEVRKLLKTTTGESEYGGVIGKMGETIIKEEIHGKRNNPPCTVLE